VNKDQERYAELVQAVRKRNGLQPLPTVWIPDGNVSDLNKQMEEELR
jgi:hypothetical protein